MTKPLFLILCISLAFSADDEFVSEEERYRKLYDSTPTEKLLDLPFGNSVLLQNEIAYRIVSGGADSYFWRMLTSPQTPLGHRNFILSCYEESGSFRVFIYAISEFYKGTMPRKNIYWFLTKNRIPLFPIFVQGIYRQAIVDCDGDDQSLARSAGYFIESYEDNAFNPFYYLAHIECLVLSKIRLDTSIDMISVNTRHNSISCVTSGYTGAMVSSSLPITTTLLKAFSKP